jgi:hypothetical protein
MPWRRVQYSKPDGGAAKIRVRSGTPAQRRAVRMAVKWCIDYMGLGGVTVNVSLGPYADCWGHCDEGDGESEYDVFIATDQGLRNLIATVTHEMVHVEQWETGTWEGDGEEEAEERQFRLADRVIEQCRL